MDDRHLISQKGNVLFLILIAVALFAALSYAVTRNSRNNGGNINVEKAKPEAAQLVQYASQIKYAITKIMVINGCDFWDISFENTIDGTRYEHTPPVSNECKIFHENGEGLTPQHAKEMGYLGEFGWYFWPYDKFYFLLQKFSGIGIEGGSSGSDLSMVGAHLRTDLCMAVNELSSIVNPSNYPPRILVSPVEGGSFEGAGSNGGGGIRGLQEEMKQEGINSDAMRATHRDQIGTISTTF